jgi:hypothetical protein
MAAVSRMDRSFLNATLNLHFLHQPLDPFPINRQLIRIPSKLCADTPGTIGRKFRSDLLDRLPNLGIIDL